MSPRGDHLRKGTAEERFWGKVSIGDDCWLWTARMDSRDRYGLFYFSPTQRHRGAHTVAWELWNGPVPEGMEVCHNCPGGDNPRCVRPGHLFVGTHADNMADRMAKGRTARGEQMRGSGGRGLTEDVVREIRRRAAAGESQHSIARSLGVDNGNVCRIVNRKRWAHVADEVHA